MNKQDTILFLGLALASVTITIIWLGIIEWAFK